MKKVKLFLMIFGLLSFYVYAESASQRTMNLFPGLVEVPFIEPKIPDHFVAMSPCDYPSVADWVYWGPRDVLNEYFKDQTSLKNPIIRVRLDMHVTQIGDDQLSIDGDQQIKKIKKLHWKNDIISYPIRSIRYLNEDGRSLVMAFMGLNSHELVLVFELIYPSHEKKPNDDANQLWENFLHKTSILSTPEMFNILGHELLGGRTIVTINDTQLQLVVEKKQSDNRLRVVVMPISGDIKFKFDRLEMGSMGLKWHFGEPLVKVYGEITAENPSLHSTIIQYQAISVLIKTVKEFSISDEELKKHPEYLVLKPKMSLN